MPAVPLKSVAIHLRPNDNIAVAAKSIPGGTELHFEDRTIALPGPVRLGHKFAVQPIKEGDAVLKYGQIIGFASRDIGIGEHVHTQNVKLGKFERDYAFATETPAPLPPPAEYRTFMGYDRGPSRPNHLRYWTRNYIAVISTVNCSPAT